MRKEIELQTVCRMLWYLTNEKSNFAIVVARYEISYRIYSKMTCDSAISSTCIRSRLCIYLYRENWIVVAHASFTRNRKIKNRWVKKAGKVRKKSRWVKKAGKVRKKSKLNWNCDRSGRSVIGYAIIPSRGRNREGRAVGTRFHGVVSLLIADCVD